MIVFTSDNGWILGEHRLRDPVTEDGTAAGVKYVPYEGSSRVPLMIAGPGFPAGRKVAGRDRATPTWRRRSSSSPARSRSCPGRDVAARGGAATRSAPDGPRRPDRDVRRTRAASRPTTSIRTERYRYDLQDDGQEGLYDLKRDPWELQSVHADPRYAQIKAILKRAPARGSATARARPAGPASARCRRLEQAQAPPTSWARLTISQPLRRSPRSAITTSRRPAPQKIRSREPSRALTLSAPARRSSGPGPAHP